MARDIVRADFEAIFKQYADKAVKRFNLTGNHPPQLYSVKLGEEPGQIKASYALNKVAPMFFKDIASKNAMRDFLIQMTTPGSLMRKAAQDIGAVVPDIVVQINEIWHKSLDKTGMSGEEFKRQSEIPASEHPDRQEAIMVNLHARQFSVMGICMIHDKPKRHAVMGELMGQEYKMVGRLSMTPDDGDE